MAPKADIRATWFTHLRPLVGVQDAWLLARLFKRAFPATWTAELFGMLGQYDKGMSFVPTDVRFPAKLRTDVRGIRHELESLVLEHAIESASWLLMLRDEQFEPIVCGIEGASWEALCDIACRLRDSRKALVQAQTRTPVGATS